MALFFFFNDTATTEIYTLSLHDALPISDGGRAGRLREPGARAADRQGVALRSEEHTSELQSRQYLVCRLLLEKKKKEYIAVLLGTPDPPLVALLLDSHVVRAHVFLPVTP